MVPVSVTSSVSGHPTDMLFSGSRSVMWASYLHFYPLNFLKRKVKIGTPTWSGCLE